MAKLNGKNNIFSAKDLERSLEGNSEMIKLKVGKEDLGEKVKRIRII